MPFISKDWRSPGEEWVKTEEGWEKKKVLECIRQFQQGDIMMRYQGDIDHGRSDIHYGSTPSSVQWIDDEDKENNVYDNSLNSRAFGEDRQKHSSDSVVPPHCHIIVKGTREISGFNGLSDAFKRLDFQNAVHDIRRFNYIVKLLEMLTTQKLATLSGCARRVLFSMLEEVARHVSSSQQNIHTLRRLVEQLRTSVDHSIWGWPLGSTLLWEKHLRDIDRILSIANHIHIREPGDSMYPKLVDIPEECLREILRRLTDHKDLENSGKAYHVMQRVVDEQRIWRELCRFHFTPQQIDFVITDNNRDWKHIYHKLRRSFGLKEEYAEMIQLCRNCRCLFWKSYGHPCIADQDPEFQEKLEDVDKESLHVPIPPQAFLKFFSL